MEKAQKELQEFFKKENTVIILRLENNKPGIVLKDLT